MSIWFLGYNSAIFCPIWIIIHIRVPETTSIDCNSIHIYLQSAAFLIKFLLFLDCPIFFGLSYFFWAVLLKARGGGVKVDFPVFTYLIRAAGDEQEENNQTEI